MNNLLLLLAEAEVNVGNAKGGFCEQTANIWQIVGYVFLVFKIVIPILIIVFGMIDLGKAVIGSKDDEVKKAANSLIRRVIAGVVIFFLPTLVSFVMGVITNFASTGAQDDFEVCKKCITSPNDTDCKSAAEDAWK